MGFCQYLYLTQQGKFASPYQGRFHHIRIDPHCAFARTHQFFKGGVEIVKLPFHHPGQMKPLIFHLKHLIHHLAGQICRLCPGIMLSILVHV